MLFGGGKMNIDKAGELIEIFEKKGFHYSRDILFNYYISLITKPFVILTGISGSGKSKIAEIFAEIVGNKEIKPYELIPVKPNWRDSKGLFGYHNLIDGGYYITPLIKLFLRALSDPENPYFLILDEMNIAKTEHYFADYLSLIESRRVSQGKIGDTLEDLEKVFEYDKKISLSEAIILSAIDINKPGQPFKIEKYRENRFSQLWKETIYGGKNWTAQYRSELNQGPNRLANRVFKKVEDGIYQLKEISELEGNDKRTVQRLYEMYNGLSTTYIEQDNIVLHNNNQCINEKGECCSCTNCPYSTENMYKCDKLYDSNNETYYVPPEMPIPLNLFTVGTVNIDETTYMFSVKVLDRSNVIEFNEVDFAGIYNLDKDDVDKLNSVMNTVTDEKFYFNDGDNMPSVRLTIPNKECVNKFILDAHNEFKDLISVFVILKKYNLHFGYRVMNEIALYMCNVMRNTSYDGRERRAMDNQILQKVLPKMYGAYEKIWRPLTEILGVLFYDSMDINVETADELMEILNAKIGKKMDKLQLDGTTADNVFKYPKSAIKILNMLSDLNDVGFATFIK